jgi:hypothetical protein
MSEDGYEAKYDDLLAVAKAAKEYVDLYFSESVHGDPYLIRLADLRQKLVNALCRVGP